MKKKTILAFVLLALCLAVNGANTLPDDDKSESRSKTEANVTPAKTWEFYSSIKELTAAELASESNYKFGKEAGCLYNMFLNVYVVREEVVPGDPTRRTVIRKPAIYNAVRSVEKQLSKDIKSNSIKLEQAAAEFTNILKVALSAIDSDTQSFEDELQKNRKDSTNLLSVFKNVKLTEI